MATTPWIQSLVPEAYGDVLSSFASPPVSVRPMLRWWWPHGLVDTDEIKREIDQMYEAGFGGAEIEDVHHSVLVEMDPEGHGWGTDAWYEAVLAASEHAEPLGFGIDMALGPAYPAANPNITPDSEGALKELVSGQVVVANGTRFSGPVPPPYHEAEEGVNTETLLTVQAYRMNDTSSLTDRSVVLDHDTLVPLKCRVRDGELSFTPPDNGTWIVLAYWERGVGQRPEAGPHTDPLSYVIDHFSAAGVESSTDFFDEHIMTPEMKDVMQSIGGSIFEDSIELESEATLWTPKLRDEFQKRIGYDLFRYLPAVTRRDQNLVFKYSDDGLTRGILNDYWEVMGQLYVDYHIGTLKPWVNDLGMKLRAQIYGMETPAMTASGLVDISEGESLGFKNLGDYRSIAGPANMMGQQIMSNEACAFAGAAYTVTWDLVLQTLNPIFTTGNNQQVLHGFSYKEAPTADWPGFAAFTPYGSGRAIGYSESWGPRTPLWRHASDITGYISREQKGYIVAGYNSPWWADSGVQQGWSLNIIGPDQLNYDSAVVTDGRLAADGPGYKVLSFEGDAYASRLPTMQLDSAEKILKLANDGLPMVVVGDWSSPTFYGWSERNETDRLDSIFDQLLSLDHVVNVATREDIGAGVAQLPFGPDVQLNGSQIINYHRKDGAADWYMLVAAAPSTYAVSRKTLVYDADADIVLPRQSADAVPVLMDLWTGSVTPIAEYEEMSETRVKLHVYIKAYSSMMVGFLPMDKKPVHAVSSNALSIRHAESGLWLRANETGSFSGRLSNGNDFEVQVDEVPAIQELRGWTLSVEDWQPTANISSSETVYKYHTLEDLDTLKPWTGYDELKDVSGMGNYTTTFSLDNWPSHAGAILDIPNFTGSLRINVNGEDLPPQDQLNTEFDIGPWLKDGENTLRVEVATTLLNRLRVVTPETYAVAARQDYGIVSPIKLKPYVEKSVSLD